MPKPMTMTIEVEEIAFGRVFRTLDAMRGVIAIHLQGTGPKKAGPTGARGGPRASSATVECLILNALTATKIATRADLVEAVTKGGRQASSVPDALSKLKTKGHLRSMSGGRFKITPAGRARYNEACVVQPEGEN